MVKGIDIRLRRLEDLCDERLKGLYSNLRARIAELLTLSEQDAFWSAIDKAKAGEGLTPEEDQAHWKFCLDPEAWELYCDWIKGCCAQKGIDLLWLPTFEEVKLLYEQNTGDQGVL
jgi:hypothetical protein